MNNSPNFSTIVSRYDLLLDELAYFAAFDVYGEDYLRQFGITFKTSATTLWEAARNGMAAALNNAADRLLDLEIDGALTLKTKSGQEKRMVAWVDKMQAVDAVPAETLKYIGALPVLDALREPKVLVTCRCGNQFPARPHAYQNYLAICPKCRQRLRVDTSKARG